MPLNDDSTRNTQAHKPPAWEAELAARSWILARRVGKHADILIAALICSALAATLWGQGGQDDAYITYWAGRVLAEHGQILNYNGLRLEQSSSLSLVLVLALVFKLTPLSMPTCGYLVSMACGVITMLLAVHVGRRMGLRSRAALVAVMGTVGCFGYWSTSGMETTLMTAAGLWFISECTRPAATETIGGWLRLAGASFLFAAARPEAPLLVVGLAAVSVSVAAVSPGARRSGPWRGMRMPCARAAVAIVTVGLLFGFRRLYFHAWWPNPALMKLGGFAPRNGAQHLWDVGILAGAFPLVLFVAGLLVVLDRRVSGAGNAAPELVSALGLAQIAFVVLSGGDWMTGSRFLAPIVPALVLTGFVALERFIPLETGRAAVAATYAATNLVFALHVLHCGLSDGQPLWAMQSIATRFDKRLGDHQFSRVELLNKLHRRDAVTASELLVIADALVAQVKTRPIYVITGQAGMIAYNLASRHFGKFQLLDLWSLTDRQLLDCLPGAPVRTGPWGSDIGQERPLRDHEQITKKCGMPLPDVFYNEALDTYMTPLFAQLGYDVIYHQVGLVKNSERPDFFGGQLGADGFIAVRHELAQAAGLHPKPIWRWDLNPP